MKIYLHDWRSGGQLLEEFGYKQGQILEGEQARMCFAWPENSSSGALRSSSLGLMLDMERAKAPSYMTAG